MGSNSLDLMQLLNHQSVAFVILGVTYSALLVFRPTVLAKCASVADKALGIEWQNSVLESCSLNRTESGLSSTNIWSGRWLRGQWSCTKMVRVIATLVLRGE